VSNFAVVVCCGLGVICGGWGISRNHDTALGKSKAICLVWSFDKKLPLVNNLVRFYFLEISPDQVQQDVVLVI
jgi:hypothetical protein